jgi:hypothetical protein
VPNDGFDSTRNARRPHIRSARIGTERVQHTAHTAIRPWTRIIAILMTRLLPPLILINAAALGCNRFAESRSNHTRSMLICVHPIRYHTRHSK